MALKDNADDDDFCKQDFDQDGLVSIWLYLGSASGQANLDILQDLCGVGHDRLSDHESSRFESEPSSLRALLGLLSYSATYVDAAVAAAAHRGLHKEFEASTGELKSVLPLAR